jgi:hypothetical protein
MNEISKLSSDLVAKLRAAEGEGLSRDAKNNPRKLVKLLQDKDNELNPESKWYRSSASAGQYLIGDKLCDDFVWTPILYLNTYVEWKANAGGYVSTHYALPADAKWDAKARCYFRPNGNSVEEGAEIAGLINCEVYWQSLRMGALTVARNLNSAASTLVVETAEGPVQLPFFGANWRIGSTEKPGTSYWQPTYELVAVVGEPGGPSLDDFDRCRRLCHSMTRAITSAKAGEIEATTDKSTPFWDDPPKSDAPPPPDYYDGPDDDDGF